MTNKVSVRLCFHGLKHSEEIYFLEEIKNIIEELFKKSNYKACIDNKEEKKLFVGGLAGNIMVFNLEINVPEDIDKFPYCNVYGNVELDEYIENSLSIQGKLVHAALVGFYKDKNGCGMLETEALLPEVAISLRKTEK